MKMKRLIPVAMLIAFASTIAFSDTPTAVMQINGEDVAQPTDTVIASFSYGTDLKGRLLDSGIDFVLIANRSDDSGTLPDSLTVFNSDDLGTICGWGSDLTSDILLRLSGNQVYCSK